MDNITHGSVGPPKQKMTFHSRPVTLHTQTSGPKRGRRVSVNQDTRMSSGLLAMCLVLENG